MYVYECSVCVCVCVHVCVWMCSAEVCIVYVCMYVCMYMFVHLYVSVHVLNSDESLSMWLFHVIIVMDLNGNNSHAPDVYVSLYKFK